MPEFRILECASNCVTCSTAGPAKCDECDTGYRVSSEKLCDKCSTSCSRCNSAGKIIVMITTMMMMIMVVVVVAAEAATMMIIV